MQGNVNIPDSTITTNLSFRQLVLMNMQQLTNFPYIEKDFDALTDYELLCLVVKYLNDVIANQNEQNDSITRMYESFLALQDYVNNTKDELEDAFNNLDDYVKNFFDNLDLQEEVNNKLDQMLEDGVLEQIIEQYLQSSALWVFDTVSDMSNATNLINGSYVKTLGYYNINDGGGATYKISNSTSNLYHQETLSSGLYANLIIDNNTINFRQLGANPCIYPNVTNKTDSKNYLLEYESLCTNNNIQYKLFIPNGLWFFSETLISRHLGVNIVGETNFSRSDYSGTVILPYADNQSYIWKIGGSSTYSDTTAITVSQMVTQTNLDNLTFSTGTYINSLNYKVTTGCLILDRIDFTTIPNINIMHFNGNGLVVRSSWEVTIGNLMFRNHAGFGTNQMLWDDTAPVTGIAPNISAFDINYMMSEGTDGSLIYSKSLSGASHNHIGHINVENGFSSGTKSNMTDNEDTSTYTPIDLIQGFFRSLIIDSINFFDNNNQKTTDNGTTYYFRSLLKDYEDPNDGYASRFNVTIGSLLFRTTSKHEVVAYSRNSYSPNKLVIGALSTMDDFPTKLFDYNFGMNTYIGAIPKQDLPFTLKSENDAINYAGKGRNNSSIRPGEDKCVLKYDVDAPTFAHLVTYTEDGTKANTTFNTYGSRIKARILYKTVDTTVTSAVLYSKNAGDTTTYTSISCPLSTSAYVWSSWSNSIDSVIGKEIAFKVWGLNIAKIEISEGE